MLGKLLLILLEKYADVGTMLVDYHQTRLDCRHDKAALILVMGRRFLGNDAFV